MGAPSGHAFTRRPETVMRDTQAVALRAQRLTYQQIADRLGMSNKGTAKRAVDRVLEHVQVEAAESYRASELAVLLAIRNELLKTFYATHVVVSDGRVVRDSDTGEALLDHGPQIAAARELRGNSESIRKLLGLDAPARSEITGSASLEVTVVDEFTRRLDALAVQLAAGPREAACLAGASQTEATHPDR